MAYISLYSYFSSRGRFGVVANNSRHIKDLYLIPLSAEDPVPAKLLPFEGPGERRLPGGPGPSGHVRPLPRHRVPPSRHRGTRRARTVWKQAPAVGRVQRRVQGTARAVWGALGAPLSVA